MQSVPNQKWSPLQLSYLSWIVFFTTPLSGLCVDVYVPSLPHLATAFNVSATLVQWTIPAYTFGLALGQLFSGPISDAIGRKQTMLIGCFFQLICILIIIFSQRMNLMIFTRAFQGFFVSFIVVPNRAILLDLFSGTQLKKKISTLTICYSFGLLLAPFIGGYLQQYYNWKAPFYFMLAYSITVLTIVLVVLPETIRQKAPLSLKYLTSNYTVLSKDSTMLLCLICTGLCSSYIVLFNLIAPFFMQLKFSLSPAQYGQIALAISAAWFLGNLLYRRLIDQPFKLKCYYSLTGTLLIEIMMLVFKHYFLSHWFPIVVATFLIVVFAALIFPNLISIALKDYRHMGGTANAYLYSGIWLLTSLAIWIASLFKVTSIISLAVSDLVVGSIVFLLFLFFLSKKSLD